MARAGGGRAGAMMAMIETCQWYGRRGRSGGAYARAPDQVQTNMLGGRAGGVDR